MNEYITELLHSRTQAHIFHLQTTSYSKHEALQEYYEDIVNILDEIVESFQGKYGKIKNYRTVSELANMQEDEDILQYFSNLADFLEQKRAGGDLPQDGFIQHKLDEVDTLVRSTIYKLKYLK